MVTAIGCANDAVVSPQPATDPGQRFWALTLDHHAVTLSTAATFDTIRLTATPRTVTGAALADLPVVTFTSMDQDRVQVDSSGLVRATGSGIGISVIASLTQGDVTRADTVIINVTSDAPPPVFGGISIQPLEGDSAKNTVYATTVITARIIDTDGADIPNAAVYYTSLDRTTAAIDPSTGVLFPVRPGHVTLVASATVYGVTKADTLLFTIGYPIVAFVSIAPRANANGQIVNVFTPSAITIGPGAIVYFTTASTSPTDITFDDPTNVAEDVQDCPFVPSLCGTGNIDAFAADPSDPAASVVGRARRFPVPGTYLYHSTIFGTTGSIVVVNDGATP